MWMPNQQEIRNYEVPSLRDAGRQIEDATRQAGRYAVENRKMIGWAATAGVFLGLSYGVGNNLGHGDVAKLLTYTGSLVGIAVTISKAQECIDNVGLKRRSA